MLASLILLPLLGSLLLFVFSHQKWASQFAIAVSFAALAIAAYFVFLFQLNKQPLAFDVIWISSLGIHFSLYLDGLSALMVLLTAGLMPFILVSASSRALQNPKVFYSLFLLAEAGLLLVFLARDGFLFYVGWELALIPVYFIAGFWGGDRRVSVTFHFFIYTVFGSLLMLLAFLGLYFLTGSPHQFSYEALSAIKLSPTTQLWIFICFFVAFAIKAPIFPFHTWQPNTYVESPASGTMLLSGIMLKMGIYGLLRWLIPLFPDALANWSWLLITLSIIGVLWGSLLALVQTDMKRMLAYSSLAHVGLITAGIFTLTPTALGGSLIQMLSHGLTVVGLFAVVDFIERRTGTRTMIHLGGLVTKAPRLAVLFMIILLGSAALPLTSGFIGEFLLLNGLYQVNPILAGVAGLSVIFGAVYLLRAYRQSVFGVVSPAMENNYDLTLQEGIVLIPLAILIILLGVFPGPVLQMSQEPVNEILKNISAFKVIPGVTP